MATRGACSPTRTTRTGAELREPKSEFVDTPAQAGAEADDPQSDPPLARARTIIVPAGVEIACASPSPSPSPSSIVSIVIASECAPHAPPGFAALCAGWHAEPGVVMQTPLPIACAPAGAGDALAEAVQLPTAVDVELWAQQPPWLVKTCTVCGAPRRARACTTCAGTLATVVFGAGSTCTVVAVQWQPC